VFDYSGHTITQNENSVGGKPLQRLEGSRLTNRLGLPPIMAAQRGVGDTPARYKLLHM